MRLSLLSMFPHESIQRQVSDYLHRRRLNVFRLFFNHELLRKRSSTHPFSTLPHENGRWCPAIGYRLSAIGYRLSAIGYRLSAIGHRLSATGHRPPAIGYRLSAIGYRLSAIGYLKSAPRAATHRLGQWHRQPRRGAESRQPFHARPRTPAPSPRYPRAGRTRRKPAPHSR